MALAGGIIRDSNLRNSRPSSTRPMRSISTAAGSATAVRSTTPGASKEDHPRVRVSNGMMFRSADDVSLEAPSAEPRAPFARPEDFEDMVGDLRRVFIGWLKRTENELRNEREACVSLAKSVEEERRKVCHELALERKAAFERLAEERRRVDAETAAAMKQIAVEREDARQRLADEREKMDREKDIWKNHMLMEKEKLMQEYALFDEERKKIVDASIAVQTSVDLNVGGVVFESSRHTLTQQPGSFLEALLSGRHQVPRDRHGRIFIDRDAELFRAVLQFLRNPTTPPYPRDATESAAICQEANYYGIKFFPYTLVFAAGGHNGMDHLNSCEVLDVAEQCWRFVSPMDTPRSYFGSAEMCGRLFLFGGANFEYKALCVSEYYDILRDKWVEAPSLAIPRRNMCGARMGQRCVQQREMAYPSWDSIFAAGGYDGCNIVSSVEAYDPRMKNWMEICPMTAPRSSATSCVLGESLFVLGGTTGERMRSVERYDSRMNKWEAFPHDMIEVRSAACSAALLGSMYVIGGTDNTLQVHSSVESLDLHTLKWIFRRALAQPRVDASCAVVSEAVMVAGGQQGDEVLASTAFYRPEMDEWTPGADMLLPRYGHALLACDL